MRSSTAWPSEPRRIGSGSGSTGAGREDVLDQPLDRAAGERLQPARGLAVARREQRADLRGRRARPSGARRLAARSIGGLRAAQLVRRRRLGRRPRDLGEQPAAAALPQLVREQRAHVVEERRRLLRPALLVRAAEATGTAPPRAARRTRRTATARARACPRGAGARARRPSRAAARSPSSRNGSGCGRCGSSPSCSPHTKHRAEPPRADRQRVGEQDAGRAFRGRLAVAHLDRARARRPAPSARRERRIGRGEARELPTPRPQLAGRAGVGLGLGAQHVGPAHVRRRPDRLGLGAAARCEERLASAARSAAASRAVRARPRPPWSES